MPPKRRQTRGTNNTGSSSSNTKKKKAKSDGPNRRPDPPPDPPTALVTLLRNDVKSMEYFLSLQRNLDYDVEKWKIRARAAQAENESLKRQLDEALSLQRRQQQQQQHHYQHQQLQLSPSSTGKGKLSPSLLAEHQEGESFNDKELSTEYVDQNKKDREPVDSFSPRAAAINGPDTSSHNVQDGKERNKSSNQPSTDVWDDPEFDFEFSSSDEEEEDGQKGRGNDDDHNNDIDKARNVKQNGKTSRRRAHNGTVHGKESTMTDSDHPPEDVVVIPKRIQCAWENLLIAQQHLEELGIYLTEESSSLAHSIASDNTKVTMRDNGEEGCSQCNIHSHTASETPDVDITSSPGDKEVASVSPIKTTRRTDQAVLRDIIHSIKAWAKLKVHSSSILSENNEQIPNEQHKYFFAAFMTQDLIPCFEPVPASLSSTSDDRTSRGIPLQHPAVRGLDILLIALLSIRVFGPVIDEIEQKEYVHLLAPTRAQDGVTTGEDGHDNNGKGHCMPSRVLVGMKNRHGMVQQFVESMEGEICNAWPYLDRTNIIATPSLWYSDLNPSSIMSDDQPEEDDDDDEEDGTMLNSSTTKDLNDLEDLQSTGVSFSSRNALRLAALAERCMMARIVTATHLHRQDPASAIRFLFNYLLCTVPSLGLDRDCYPRLPPVQSICLIEAMLRTGVVVQPVSTGLPSSERHVQLIDYIIMKHTTERDHNNRMYKVLIVALTASASIFQSRSGHSDPRISEIGRVEMAAYRRLIRIFRSTSNFDDDIGTLIDNDIVPLSRCSDDIKDLADDFVTNLATTRSTYLSDTRKMLYPKLILDWILPLIWILQGNVNSLRLEFTNVTASIQASTCTLDLAILMACARAIRQLEIRKIDNYREVMFGTFTTKIATISHSLLDDLIRNLKTFSGQDPQQVVTSLLRICRELADGDNALRVVHWYWCNRKPDNAIDLASTSLMLRPMVRVITLQRREDRRATFMSQAMQEGLLVMKGVIAPDYWVDTDHPISDVSSPSNIVGTYAIDGSQGTPATVERQLIDWVRSIPIGSHNGNDSSGISLQSMVAQQWRPNDLQAFDTNAPDDPNLMVSLSPSEKACALSHIATWKGVAMTLPSGLDYGGPMTTTPSSSFRDTNGWAWAGLARGEPLQPHVHPDGLPPTPVALILEDDAVLVDRFADQLDEILKELPRDFHYCAIGYARPKNAPLVDYPSTRPGGGGGCGGICKQIKLPTMTWYLTGYLLSGDGARYLLRHLPVIGPVDTWMGHTMILGRNWDNDYGRRVGVGMVPHQQQRGGSTTAVPSSAATTVLSRKELRTCLRFRAYCATVPLCHQKVGNSGSSSSSSSVHQHPNHQTGSSVTTHHQHQQHRYQQQQHNWRSNRDSDIVYSGNVGTSKTRPR